MVGLPGWLSALALSAVLPGDGPLTLPPIRRPIAISPARPNTEREVERPDSVTAPTPRREPVRSETAPDTKAAPVELIPDLPDAGDQAPPTPNRPKRIASSPPSRVPERRSSAVPSPSGDPDHQGGEITEAREKKAEPDSRPSLLGVPLPKMTGLKNAWNSTRERLQKGAAGVKSFLTGSEEVAPGAAPASEKSAVPTTPPKRLPRPPLVAAPPPGDPVRIESLRYVATLDWNLHPEAVDLLFASLDDEEETVRHEALTTLGRRLDAASPKDPDPVRLARLRRLDERLTQLLTDENSAGGLRESSDRIRRLALDLMVSNVRHFPPAEPMIAEGTRVEEAPRRLPPLGMPRMQPTVPGRLRPELTPVTDPSGWTPLGHESDPADNLGGTRAGERPSGPPQAPRRGLGRLLRLPFEQSSKEPPRKS
jgi:hypothetical protein